MVSNLKKRIRELEQENEKLVNEIKSIEKNNLNLNQPNQQIIKFCFDILENASNQIADVDVAWSKEDLINCIKFIIPTIVKLSNTKK